MMATSCVDEFLLLINGMAGLVEDCDETFHVDRRERAQPGNGQRKSLPLLGVCFLFFCHHHILLPLLSI